MCTAAPAATSAVFLPSGLFLILRANSIPAPGSPGVIPQPVPSSVCCLQLPSPCPECPEQVRFTSPASAVCCGCRALGQALTHTCPGVTGVSRTLADHTRTGQCCLKAVRVVHVWPAQFRVQYSTLVCAPAMVNRCHSSGSHSGSCPFVLNVQEIIQISRRCWGDLFAEGEGTLRVVLFHEEEICCLLESSCYLLSSRTALNHLHEHEQAALAHWGKSACAC